MFYRSARGFVVVWFVFVANDVCHSSSGREIIYYGHSIDRDCDSYIANGTGYTYSCPNMMRFNNKLQACDFQGNVGNDCNNLLPVIETEISANSSSCEDIDLDYLPLPSDCSGFLLCYKQKAWHHDCPRGLHFDKDQKKCRSTTPSPCALDPRCSNDVEFLPYLSDCTKYVACYFGASYVLSCPKGLWFDLKRERCYTPRHSNCSVTESPRSFPKFECTGSIIRKSSYGCRFYDLCEGGRGVVKSCRDGLAYDQNRQLCSANASKSCQDYGQTVAVWTSPDIEDQETLSYWYPGCVQDGVLLQHLSNETMFLECIRNVAFERNCPEGLKFVETRGMCDVYAS